MQKQEAEKIREAGNFKEAYLITAHTQPQNTQQYYDNVMIFRVLSDFE